MPGPQLPPLVARLFARSPARTTRVGLEQELLVRDRVGATVPVPRLRAALGDLGATPGVSFEPGGQVELNLPAARDAAAAAADYHALLARVSARLARIGVTLHADATDPRPEREVPLRLRSARYLAMQEHFDSVGPAGRRMMRRTASTQVCLDWWPGRAGTEQWRVLLLAGPFLAAATARDTGPGCRLATWLEVDPSRTGFDGRLLHGGDPATAYTAFAADATRFVRGESEHLTTLFPPVRPRGGYLEVRYLDVQEDPVDVASQLAAILYDDDLRRTLLRRLEPLAGRLDELWSAAAAGELDQDRVAA